MPDETVPGPLLIAPTRHGRPLDGLADALWPPAATAALRRRDAGSLFRVLLGIPLVQAFARFLAVGCMGLAVDATLFSILDMRGLRPEVSRAASLVLATIVTWQLNRHLTFGASHRRAPVEAMRYALVALAAQGFSYSVFLALVYSAPWLPKLTSLLIGAGLAAFAGFAGHKLFAFAPARLRSGDPRP